MEEEKISPKAIESVVPRIYVDLPDAGQGSIKLTPEDSPVVRGLPGDILVLYAFDTGTHFEIVSQGDREELGVSSDELHERAISNLRNLELEVQAHQGARVTMLTAGGDYEATLLLLPEVWDSVQAMVEGDIVASVPARDIIYFVGDSSPENISELRALTSRMLEVADKPLSRTFLRRSGDDWVKYEGHAE
ncbi:DUF1444 family protein [Luteolibacter marinus]|uniref:DUF1444 family protein n=1 Tax=Luteolibacter marinus TaxID=2776705 RepID=UPI001868AB8F|nr:DUF1444 family protein [Luteolibacter marinus]